MAGVATEETAVGRSFEGVSIGQQQSRCPAGEEQAECRSSEHVENGSPSTSPFWDSDDDDDDGGPKPSNLHGKHTWKIDKYSQINKRELKSNAFEVGGYKWYILIYPQGCDVSNHLSLFLCVANHDKLLPGWSHFAQFTIAVVNKEPKKSKYSDTLHRFWKKEHDWGWKKFMELSKVQDGFAADDTLIIKAQVQVIRERPDRPFRCLNCTYRRELIRVYLSNVEQICRRFVEERRAKLGKLLEDKARWFSFCSFWLDMDQSSRRHMSQEKSETILKVVVKHFFIEKEVTSTLVMDSLHSGLKALEHQSKGKKSKDKFLEAEELPLPIVGIEKDTFILVDDVLLLLERAAMEPLPPKDEKGPQNRTKDGTVGDETNKDPIFRDERRLTELGRRTIEIFVLAHIFSKIEVAYQEAVALKKQEELIREEEAAWLAEIEQKSRRGVDKDKKSKKKQGKQKKKKNKGKDDKTSCIVEDKIQQDTAAERKEITAEPEDVLEKSEPVDDASDASDSIDCVILLPDSDDRDASPVNWDTDNSEVHPHREASGCATSVFSGMQNGTEGRSSCVVDDSSSTCSSDSIPSVRSVPQKSNSPCNKNKKSRSRGRNHQSKMTSGSYDRVNEEPSKPFEVLQDARNTVDLSRHSNAVERQYPALGQSLQEKVSNGSEKKAEKKDEETGSLHKVLKTEDTIVVEASVTSSPKSPSNGTQLIAPLKLEMMNNAPVGPVVVKKLCSDSPKRAGNSVLSKNSPENTATLKPLPQKFTTSKPTDKPSGYQKHVATDKIPTQELTEPVLQKYITSKPAEKASDHQKSVESQKLPALEGPITSEKPFVPPIPVMSRPFSAPLVAGPRPSVSVVSIVQTAPALARSVSAAGRLGPETSTYGAQTYVPQSYRNAMMGGSVAGSSSTFSQNHSTTSVVNPPHSYSQAPVLASAPMFSPHSCDRIDTNSVKPSLPFGMVNCHDHMLQNGTLWTDRPQRDHNNSLENELQSLDLSRSQEHLLAEFPACTSGRQNNVLPDEFPHLAIINDLLDDEHGVGTAARVNSNYQMYGSALHHHHHHHNINRHYSFPGDSGSACRFDRVQNYHDDGFQHGYGVSGRSYDTLRDMVAQAGYLNGQVDGVVHNQWQMGGSDPQLLMDGDSYLHNLSEYHPNQSVGINGYTMFRPSNGL